MDDVTRKYLTLQRRLTEEGLDPDYVELVFVKRAEEIEGEMDLDALTDLIVKETPEKFRTAPPEEESGDVSPYDELRERERRKQERAEEEREARVTAFDRLRGGLR